MQACWEGGLCLPLLQAEYTDPISLSWILDPCVLCATGQVYDYGTLREWFSTGNRCVRLCYIRPQVLTAQGARCLSPVAGPV